MKTFIICFLLLLNMNTVFAETVSEERNRNEQNLYYKNKKRLHEQKRRAKDNANYAPDDPRNATYHQNYYQHQYDHPEYYE